MEKYENMVSRNKRRCEEKEYLAVSTIKMMLRDDEQVTVSALVEKTGLSRAYFYKNESVRKEVERALELQDGKIFVRPQEVILNKMIQKENNTLKKKLAEKETIISTLLEKIKELEKQVKDQELAYIKTL